MYYIILSNGTRFLVSRVFPNTGKWSASYFLGGVSYSYLGTTLRGNKFTSGGYGGYNSDDLDEEQYAIDSEIDLHDPETRTKIPKKILNMVNLILRTHQAALNTSFIG